jgi:hypothetical protein
VSEEQFNDMFENVVYAIMYLEAYPNTEKDIVKMFADFDDDDALKTLQSLF